MVAFHQIWVHFDLACQLHPLREESSEPRDNLAQWNMNTIYRYIRRRSSSALDNVLALASLLAKQVALTETMQFYYPKTEEPDILRKGLEHHYRFRRLKVHLSFVLNFLFIPTMTQRVIAS